MPVPSTAPPRLRRVDELARRPEQARALYLARVERGWRLADLEAASGIHITALSRYENGHVRPSAANLRRILDALAEAAS